MEKDKMILTDILLDTDNASILYTDENGKLWDSGLITKSHPNPKIKNQNIYLCSTLPIKEGDWFIDLSSKIVYQKFSRSSEWKLDNNLVKIEFTTDPKLISDGVTSIDGNTKALVRCGKLKNSNVYDYASVNFLSEFVKRWNEKDNQKPVDVEKLARKFYRFPQDGLLKIEQKMMINHFTNGYYQSNVGGFNSKDLSTVLFMAREKEHGIYKYAFDEIIQSLNKEQRKGDIVIELNDGKLIFK